MSRVMNCSAGQLTAASRQQETVRRSELSPAGQWLVDDMRRLGFGHYDMLLIRGTEPIIKPRPRRVRDHRFLGERAYSPKTELGDYILPNKVIEMFDQFRDVVDGVVLRLEVRDGLPYRMEIEDSDTT